MPIFEYICEDCHQHAEMLVHSGDEVKCPSCQSAKMAKQFSVFAMSNGGQQSDFKMPAPSTGHTHHGGCGCGAPRPGACQN